MPVITDSLFFLLPRTGRKNTERFESFVHMYLNESSGSQNMGSADGSQTKVQSVSLHEDFKILCL